LGRVILILILSIFICCKSSKTIEMSFHGNPFEPGKCYISTLNEESQSSSRLTEAFLIKIKNPSFNDYESKLTINEIEQFDPLVENYQIEIREPYLTFHFRNDLLSEFTERKDQIGFIFCYVEVPGEYKIISKDDLLNEKTKVIRTKVTGKAKLLKTRVKIPPDSLFYSNQFFMDSGSWSILEELGYSNYDY